MPHGGVEHLLAQRKFSRENAVRSYAHGGSVQATAQKLQSMGRNGDTILAHINPEEAAMLKRMGGSGKINPKTGLMSFDNPSMGAYDGPKTDTSGGPGSAPGGDKSSSGSQGMGAGTGSSGSNKADTSGGPGSAPGGDGSKTGSQGMGAGTGSMPSGGIADLPAPTATEAGSKDIPQRVKDAFKFGIIPIEGGVNPKTGKPLTSTKGAHGIAQVMEATGPEAAADAGLAWDKGKWLTDTDYNYAIGEAYFNKLVNKYDGDLTKAAGAYNYGPGNFDKYLSGKKGLPSETKNYLNDFTNKISNLSSEPKTRDFTIPDPQAAASPTDPLKALTPTNVPTTPEKSWWDQAVENAPGTLGNAALSAVVPGVGLYGLVAAGTNFLTGEKTLPPVSDMINDAYYGKGTTPQQTDVYGGYGPQGGEISNLNPDTLKMYEEMYGGGRDKPLLGIQSLKRSPLVPEIDPSVPKVPLFEFDYSKFGIKGE